MEPLHSGLDAIRVGADVVRPLRALILRPGQPLDRSIYPNDDDPHTCHIAVVQDGQVLAVSSIGMDHLDPRTHPGRPSWHGDQLVWRLRGMATAEGQRGRGLGRLALDAGVDAVRTMGAAHVWANARLGAVGFYLREGWTVISPEFDLPEIGPHHVMVLPLQSSGLRRS